jgi:predicted small lipoprotein YifL
MRNKISMSKSVLLLLATAVLAACGLKGPLFLPAQKPEASPAAAAVPASGAQPDDTTKPAPARK